MDIHGMYVGQLHPDELDWFNSECAAGRACRKYTFLGLSKVYLGGPEYCIAGNEDEPCPCGACEKSGVCRALNNRRAPVEHLRVVMVPRGD